MKIYFTIIIIFLSFSFSIGQKWDNIYGYQGTNESFKEVIGSYDNGYFICSSFEEPNGTWIIKTGINGEIVWDKTLVWNVGYLGMAEIAQDFNGNIITASAVSGSFTGFWPWITKLNPCGEKEWCRVLPNEAYSHGWYDDVLVLENGDMVALAHFISEEINDWLFLDYIDSDGNHQWRQGYAMQENHPYIRSCSGDGIKKYGDNYLIHGYCYYPFPNALQRPLFIMLDSLFNEKWVLPFGTNDTIIGFGYETIQLNDTVFMGVGSRRLEGIKQNSLLMFFSIDGEEIKFEQIQNDDITLGLSTNFIHDIARINESKFLASTYFRFGEEPGQWGEMIIDTTGYIYQYEMRDQSTTDWTSMIKTFDNKYTIGCGWDEGNGTNDIYLYKINENLEHDTIYPGNYTYDSLCPYTIESGEIDISDCITVSVGEVPTLDEFNSNKHSINIKAFPNPVNGNEVTFELQNTEYHSDMELRIFDVFGKEVHSEKVYQFQVEARINVRNWKKGIYIALVYSEEKVVGECKFFVN